MSQGGGDRAERWPETVLETMVEGVCALDASGRIVYLNAAAERMLGSPRADLVGQTLTSLVDRVPPTERCALAAIPADAAGAGEELLVGHDGRPLTITFSAAPLVDEQRGQGRVVVFRDVSEEAAERRLAQRERDTLTWLARTRAALDEEGFELFAQPIVPLTGGEPRDELLLRMRSARGDVILPGRFLPTAERFGLIGEIDRWVVAQAVQMVAQGRRVQANLSARSATTGLVAWLGRLLGEAGADPSLLTLELTETALMEDLDAGIAFARALTDLGCDLALDDFGTGYGSLMHLKCLPVCLLKIDVGFVRHVARDPVDEHLVRAIVNLARGVGSRTIAEGVEDAETLARITELGVDYAQGYLLGRPTPVDRPA